MVCRACAVLPALDAQLAKGRREGTAGSIVALVLGIMLLIGTLAWGLPALGGSGYGRKGTARLVGLGCGLGLVLIIAAVRNLRIYGSKKR
jgi:hypothetical protein